MTSSEVIRRLIDAKGQRKAIADASGGIVSYRWIVKVIAGDISNPGSAQIDWLRSYFLSKDIMRGRH